MKYFFLLLMSTLVTFNSAFAAEKEHPVKIKGFRLIVLLKIAQETIQGAVNSPDSKNLDDKEVSRIRSLVSEARNLDELETVVLLFQELLDFSDVGECEYAPLYKRLSRGEYEALNRISLIPGERALKFLLRIQQKYQYHAANSLMMEELVKKQKALTKSRKSH